MDYSIQLPPSIGVESQGSFTGEVQMCCDYLWVTD